MADFREDEHPRDEDGKFTDKANTPVRRKFDHYFREDVKINFEIQNRKIKEEMNNLKRLKEMKEDQKINPQKYEEKIAGEPFQSYIDIKIGIWERKVKQEEEAMQVLKQTENSFNLPPVVKLPEKPNTHPVGEKGFKFGVKKFKNLKMSAGNEPIIVGGITKEEMGGVYIDSSLNKNASELALKNYEIVKEAWNELSDEDRELVDVLKFRFSNSSQKNMGMHVDRVSVNGKIFTPAYLEITLSNSLTTPTEAINTLMHEVAHAKWSKIEKEHPEKVEKFNKTIREIGAPTPYVQTYQHTVDDVKYENLKLRHGKEYLEASDIKRANLEMHMERDLKNAELIFGNEAHSEFYAMVNAPTLNYGHTITKDNMDKIAIAFKELHGLE